MHVPIISGCQRLTRGTSCLLNQINRLYNGSISDTDKACVQEGNPMSDKPEPTQKNNLD